jgi:NADH-quinone oxidoreductase subunit G
MARDGAGRLTPVNWAEALDIAAGKIREAGGKIGVIAGDLQDAESMKAAKDLFGPLGASLDCRQDGTVLGGGPRESWLFNPTVNGIDQADAILIVGANPRLESPVLNARIRRQYLAGKAAIGVIGEAADLTYGYEHLGGDAAAVSGLAKSKAAFAKAFKAAQRPLVIIGQGALADAGSLAALAGLAKSFNLVREGWNGWAVLHTAASRVAGLDMGFVPAAGGKTAADLVKKGGAKVLVLLGADELDLSRSDAFKIYIGTHGDAGAHAADLILPGAAYTEKDGVYVNTEGRVQLANRAVFPKGEAKEDWAILRALSERLGQALPYDTLDALRARLFADHPTFGQIDFAPGSIPAKVDLTGLGDAATEGKGAYASTVRAFHLTNPIARASVTMAECASLAAGAKLAAE